MFSRRFLGLLGLALALAPMAIAAPEKPSRPVEAPREGVRPLQKDPPASAARPEARPAAAAQAPASGTVQPTPETRKEKQNAAPALERAILAFTFWVAALTAVLFIASLAQLYLFFWQWRLMRQSLAETKAVADAARAAAQAATGQAELAREALVAAHRPWIKVGAELAGPVRYNESGNIVFPIRFAFENIGHSPAYDVHESSRILAGAYVGFAGGEAQKAQKEIIESMKHVPRIDDYKIGHLIFPKECAEAYADVSGDTSQVIGYEVLEQTVYKNWLPIILVGAVQYRSAVSDAYFITGFMFDIELVGRTYNFVSFPLGENIEPGQEDLEIPAAEVLVRSNRLQGGYVE